MKSAREIANDCLPPVDDCIGPAECASCMGDHDARERIAEVIQWAREDGARWAISEIVEMAPERDCTMEFAERMNPADVRKVAP